MAMKTAEQKRLSAQATAERVYKTIHDLKQVKDTLTTYINLYDSKPINGVHRDREAFWDRCWDLGLTKQIEDLTGIKAPPPPKRDPEEYVTNKIEKPKEDAP